MLIHLYVMGNDQHSLTNLPRSDDVMPAFAPLHAVATRKACELLQGTGESCPHVLDIGSAAGEPALSVALALPDAEVVATDFSGLAALGGRARAARAGARNIIFQFSDAEDLQFDDDSFDLVVCCLVLSVCDENAALGGIERILKPGGAVLIIDFAELAESAYLRSVQAAVAACVPEHASLSASFGLRPWRLCEEASGTGICQRLHDLGFEDYSEEDVHVALDTAGESDEQLWARVRGPMLALLETMRDIDQTDVKDSEALPARQAFLAALRRPGEETAGGSGGIRWRDNKFRMWTARKPRSRGWGIF